MEKHFAVSTQLRQEASASNIDLERWRRVASGEAKEGWHDRARLAAAFLRPGDIVCDLGAGSRPLKNYLPDGAQYLPVDCVDTLPGTHIADFNSPDFTLPAEHFSVLTALGVVNWLNSAEMFLERLVNIAEGKFFIFTYDLWKPEGKLGTLEGCVSAFSPYVRNLTAVMVLRRRVFFTGTLGRGKLDAVFRQPTTNIYLKYLRPQEYLVLKLLKLPMMPRWLA